MHQPIVPAVPLNTLVTSSANLVSEFTDDRHSSFYPVRWHKQQVNDCRYQSLQSIFCRVNWSLDGEIGSYSGIVYR